MKQSDINCTFPKVIYNSVHYGYHNISHTVPLLTLKYTEYKLLFFSLLFLCLYTSVCVFHHTEKVKRKEKQLIQLMILRSNSCHSSKFLVLFQENAFHLPQLFYTEHENRRLCSRAYLLFVLRGLFFTYVLKSKGKIKEGANVEDCKRQRKRESKMYLVNL